MIRPFPTLAASLLACTLLQGQATAPVSAFDTLVSDLGGDDWGKRQAAEDAIVDLGPAVAAQVSDALDKTRNVETRERLQSVLARISREELLLPTIVTIQQKFDRPMDAFIALAAKVDLTVTTENPEAAAIANENRPIQLNIDKKPWLEALSEVIAVTNINVRLDEGKLLLHRTPPGAIRRPTGPVGAVTIGGDGARRRQSIDLTSDNNVVSGNTTFRIAVMTEPKVKFRANSVAMVLHRMLDDQGKSILADSQRRIGLQRESAGRSLAQYSVGVGNKFKLVSLIEGELQGEIITRTTELRVDDFTSLPQTLDSPTGEVSIESLTPVSGPTSQLVVQVSQASRSSTTGQMDFITAMNAGELRILDQNGETMRMTLTNQQGMNGALSITLTVTGKDANAKPTKLIWTIAAQIRSVKLPFVLRDLPLPP